MSSCFKILYTGYFHDKFNPQDNPRFTSANYQSSFVEHDSIVYSYVQNRLSKCSDRGVTHTSS